MNTGMAGSPGRLPVAADETARHVVATAVWAPSVHNTQPWWFTTGEREICLHADTTRQLAVADPYGREMLMSCGAALFTARLALRALGWVPDTSVLPEPGEPDLVARISWQQRADVTEREQQLAAQVHRRRTHRGGFEPLPVPDSLLAVLQSDAERENASLLIVSDEGRKAVLAAITEAAERVLRLDSARSRELARWTFPPGSPRRDGVPPTAYPAHPERTVPSFSGRDFAHGHGWGQPPLSVPAYKSAGVACVLTTPGDSPADWVGAGQALQRVLLTAGLYGVAAALHSQPTEVAWLRERLRADFCGSAWPQLVLRLGAVIQTEQSVRRASADVLYGRDDAPPARAPARQTWPEA